MEKVETAEALVFGIMEDTKKMLMALQAHSIDAVAAGAVQDAFLVKVKELQTTLLALTKDVEAASAEQDPAASTRLHVVRQNLELTRKAMDAVLTLVE